jgi:hypothetical protein
MTAMVAACLQTAALARPFALQRHNRAVRQWYLRTVQRIPQLDRALVARGASLEQRAFSAWRWRKRARIVARSQMLDKDLLRTYQVRDLRRYGDPNGPSFGFLVRDARERGLRGAAVYRDILRSSQATDDRTNERFGLSRPAP